MPSIDPFTYSTLFPCLIIGYCTTAALKQNFEKQKSCICHNFYAGATIYAGVTFHPTQIRRRGSTVRSLGWTLNYFGAFTVKTIFTRLGRLFLEKSLSDGLYLGRGVQRRLRYLVIGCDLRIFYIRASTSAIRVFMIEWVFLYCIWGSRQL